jgi:hypothetical protein
MDPVTTYKTHFGEQQIHFMVAFFHHIMLMVFRLYKNQLLVGHLQVLVEYRKQFLER